MISTLLAVVMTCPGTPVQAEASSADAIGRFQYEVRLPGQPISLTRDPIARVWCVPLPPGLRITKVRTFVGWDRGAIAEAVLTVTAGSYKLVTRSEHKETAANYDAMRSETVAYETGPGETPLAIYLGAWTTVAATTKIEVGVIVEVERVERVR